MGHHAPLRARSHNPAQSIEHFAQAVLSLRRIFRHQGQVWSDKAPFIIAYITGIVLSFHIPILPKVHNRL